MGGVRVSEGEGLGSGAGRAWPPTAIACPACALSFILTHLQVEPYLVACPEHVDDLPPEYGYGRKRKGGRAAPETRAGGGGLLGAGAGPLHASP